MSEVDPEILYAAALGATLARMRDELDEPAIKRVLAFVLDRWGVDVPGLHIRTMPKRTLTSGASVHEVFPDVAVDVKSTAHQPMNRTHCPICGATVKSPRGLNGHMYQKHGTTPKEYARQQENPE